jgi:hypothetical protein
MVLGLVIRSKSHSLYVTSFSTVPARACFHAVSVRKRDGRNTQAAIEVRNGTLK